MARAQTIIARSILALAIAAGGFMAVARSQFAPAPTKRTAAVPDTVARIGPSRIAAADHAVRSPGAGAPAAAPAPLVIKRVLAIGPIRFGDWAWDEDGVPAGPIVVTVDVAAQTLSVFRGGYEIGASAILYGADEKPTPLGTFPITQKDAHHVSRTYGGAPMPFALRLTPDGVFIHGSKVAWGYATHGCVGVPVAFARKLFGVASVGDRVIITKGRFVGVGDAIAS